MKRKKRYWIGMVCCILWGSIGAQDFDVINHPGYVNLNDIPIPANAGDVTEVSIGPELFQMLRQFSGGEHIPPLPNLDGLVNIQVKSFPVDDKRAETIRSKMEKLENRLRRENWQPLIRVRSGREFTNISVKYSKDKKKSLGLFIMTLDPDQKEASFVNIVGHVDLDALRDFNVGIRGSALDSLKKTLREGEE